ncbi:MAG: putative alanine and proline rich rane protein [Mycobacterium sp.]|nr:putative alanine and proline rich rane protein [Mycobacterium sp.]
MVPPAVPRRSRGAIVLAGLAVVLAAAALAVSIATWLDTRPTVAQYPPDQQTAARATACAAYTTVSTGVSTNTNLTSPGDVTGALAVAANARVALIGGGQYVLARIDPATPADLAATLRDFGNTLMDFGAAATSGALSTDPAQVALAQRIDELNTALGRQCA